MSRRESVPQERAKTTYRTMRFRLISFVFLMMLYAGILTGATVLILHMSFGFLPFVMRSPILAITILLLPSVIIGTALTAIFGKSVLAPVQELVRAAKKVGEGDFSVRVGTNYGISEVAELQDTFNHMAEDLGNIEVFHNDFVNNFSHEFKTPIVSIRGFAHELRYGDLSEAQKNEYLEIICKESDRLSKMASEILLLSRLEHRSILTGRTEYDLDEQIRSCILLLEKEWSEKELELDIELDRVSCYASEELLSQIWINLLSNAVKFTPSGGQVRVTLTASARMATVTVSDSGIGMSEEVRAHIFEKFYQGDSSHRSAGNGIGLTLAKRIVELCDGTIAVESEEGKGSTFTVTLPIALTEGIEIA